MEIVAYQPELHNGLYVCYASNALGSEEYRDTNLFYLHSECKPAQNLTMYARQLGLKIVAHAH